MGGWREKSVVCTHTHTITRDHAITHIMYAARVRRFGAELVENPTHCGRALGGAASSLGPPGERLSSALA